MKYQILGASIVCALLIGFSAQGAELSEQRIATSQLENKAPVNAEHDTGVTPLYIARQEGHADLISRPIYFNDLGPDPADIVNEALAEIYAELSRINKNINNLGKEAAARNASESGQVAPHHGKSTSDTTQSGEIHDDNDKEEQAQSTSSTDNLEQRVKQIIEDATEERDLSDFSTEELGELGKELRKLKDDKDFESMSSEKRDFSDLATETMNELDTFLKKQKDRQQGKIDQNTCLKAMSLLSPLVLEDPSIPDEIKKSFKELRIDNSTLKTYNREDLVERDILTQSDAEKYEPTVIVSTQNKENENIAPIIQNFLKELNIAKLVSEDDK